MTDQTSNLIFKGWSFNVFFITFEIKSHTLRKKSTWLEIPSFSWNIPKWMEKLNSPFSLGGLGWWAPGYWRSHQTHSDISGLSSDAPRPKITWNFWTHDLRLHRVSPAQGLDLGVGWRMGEWSPWSEKWGMVYVFTRWKHESILHSMPTISSTEWEQRKNIDICCKLKQHHCKFDAILKCYNLLMDTTSWMLPRIWVVFWNVACPAHPVPGQLNKHPQNNEGGGMGPTLQKVALLQSQYPPGNGLPYPTTSPGKIIDSKLPLKMGYVIVARRLQLLFETPWKEASRYHLYHVVHHGSSACYSNKDVMISLLQQWLNHSAPKKTTNTKPPTRLWNSVWDCSFLLRKLPNNSPSAWRNFKPSTIIFWSFHPTTPRKRPELCLWLQRLTWAHLDWKNTPQRWRTGFCFFCLPNYDISPTCIFLKLKKIPY